MNNLQAIDVIESYLNKCLNVKDGRCNLTWKHEDCKVLMDILYELTENDKYKETSWEFDQKQTTIWD
jgi:hypothetical protein